MGREYVCVLHIYYVHFTLSIQSMQDCRGQGVAKGLAGGRAEIYNGRGHMYMYTCIYNVYLHCIYNTRYGVVYIYMYTLCTFTQCIQSMLGCRG